MKDYHWELIGKYLAGEADAGEKKELETLLAGDEAFAAVFAEAKQIWDDSKYAGTLFNKERIIQLRDKKIKRAKKLSFRRLLPYAAVLAAVLVAVYFLFANKQKQVDLFAKNSAIINYQMPDGSFVSLKKGAEISYNQEFDRSIKLIKGEAFFSIKKDHGKGFIVSAPDYTINVLGTKFDVNTNSKNTTVVLAEGKIKLTAFGGENAKQVFIKPGEKALYDRRSRKLSLSEVNPAVYYLWKEKRLEFNRFSLSDLKEVFKIYYHKTLIIRDKQLYKRQIGGSAPTDDAGLIVKGLSEILHRNITQSNDTIIIE